MVYATIGNLLAILVSQNLREQVFPGIYVPAILVREFRLLELPVYLKYITSRLYPIVLFELLFRGQVHIVRDCVKVCRRDKPCKFRRSVFLRYLRDRLVVIL